MGAAKKITEQEEDHSQEMMHILSEGDHPPAGHGDSEGVWLISYADMMTLLMGFFALLTSMATFEEEKFSQVGEEVAKYWGGEVEKPYQNLADEINKVIKEKGLQNQVKTEVKKTSIAITFEGTLFFDSGSIQLKESADLLMSEIIKILGEKAKTKKFLIEGHTDSNPISAGVIASNWELSALRASSVARLFEKQGFLRNQIMTIGLGETRPLENENVTDLNLKANAQSKNRRVILKILDQLPL